MQVKTVLTSELQGAALDYAVATTLNAYMPRRLHQEQLAEWFLSHWRTGQGAFNYSSDWSVAGPIIEQNNITWQLVNDYNEDNRVYLAKRWVFDRTYSMWRWHCEAFGGSAQEACMRCFVVSRLAKYINIPTAILEE